MRFLHRLCATTRTHSIKKQSECLRLFLLRTLSIMLSYLKVEHRLYRLMRGLGGYPQSGMNN